MFSRSSSSSLDIGLNCWRAGALAGCHLIEYTKFGCHLSLSSPAGCASALPTIAPPAPQAQGAACESVTLDCDSVAVWQAVTCDMCESVTSDCDSVAVWQAGSDMCDMCSDM